MKSNNRLRKTLKRMFGDINKIMIKFKNIIYNDNKLKAITSIKLQNNQPNQ